MLLRCEGCSLLVKIVASMEDLDSIYSLSLLLILSGNLTGDLTMPELCQKLL